MAVTKLVLVRHGESEWNKENRFTGWTDVELSEKAVLKHKRLVSYSKEGFSFDFAYTSVLKRAIHTLWNITDQVNQQWLPVEKSWKLNERHYGALGVWIKRKPLQNTVTSRSNCGVAVLPLPRRHWKK